MFSKFPVFEMLLIFLIFFNTSYMGEIFQMTLLEDTRGDGISKGWVQILKLANWIDDFP